MNKNSLDGGFKGFIERVKACFEMLRGKGYLLYDVSMSEGQMDKLTRELNYFYKKDAELLRQALQRVLGYALRETGGLKSEFKRVF